MKKAINKILAVTLVATMAIMMLVGGATLASAEASTGVGLAAHALTAYREGWSYVWGGTSYGAVDCSGLIASYNGVGGMRTDMLASSSEWGYVNAGVPRIHGLGLHQPGHIGVYIGSGMAVDARDEHSGVVYHNVYSKSWVEWFKVAGVSYPQNGWVLLDGDSFYYEDGQYVVSTSRTIDGVTYTFDGAGVSNIAPPSSAYQATDYSSVSAPQSTKTEEPSYEESSEEPSIEPSEEESSEPESSVEESSEEPEPSVEESSEESIEESSEEPEVSEEESSEPEPVEESSEEVIEESSEAETIEESFEESIEESFEEFEAIEESSEESIEESSEPEAVEQSFEESAEESSEEPEAVEESSEASIEESSEPETAAEVSEESIEESSTVEESSKEVSEVSKEAKEESSKAEESTVEIVVTIAEYGDSDTDESKTVSDIQNKLYELGYLSSKATGYFDEDTISAVMIFQDINGLEATGIVDGDTYELLNSDKAQSNFIVLSLGSADDGATAYVAALQTRLTELKYFYGDVTGFYDDLTVNAVRQFQKDNGIDESGLADEETQLGIFNSNAKENPNAGSVVYGMKGDAVTKLQKRLIELRYLSGKTTGTFDKATLDAVHAYQKAAGLEQADLLTEKQLDDLYSINAQKASDYDVLKYGYQGDDVAELQTKLAGLKYYNGKNSGVYNEELVTAVKQFQKENGLKETGLADADTLDAIKTESQRENSQAGNQLILKTSEIADDALAGLAETKTEELSIAEENTDNMIKNGIIFGIVLLFAGTMTIVFIVKLKSDKKKKAYQEVTVVKYKKK